MRTPALLLVGVLALGGASRLRPALLEKRQAELGSVAPVAPPPDVAVAGVFLGAFRGLAVDYLWLRALRLEDEGKFFEALDLADWITKLEPRLEQVWSFKAHALAYNASVATDVPEQRFRWIENGIKLLRDNGIPINPRSPELYFMLSRIYSDRIGQPFDDHHLYLKRSVVGLFTQGFGPPGEETPLEDLAAAPLSAAELEPEAQKLIAALGKYARAIDSSEVHLDALLAHSPEARRFWDEARADPARRALAVRVEAFERAAWLRLVKIDPRLVLELDRTYGPLDWRGCDAQALYWAVLGARAARTLGPERAFREERRLERLSISAVKNALRRGRLIVEPDGEVFFAPVPQLAQRVVQLYDDAIERAHQAELRGEVAQKEDVGDEDADDDGHHHPDAAAAESVNAGAYGYSLAEAEKDFFVEAIMVLAQYGRDAEARKIFAKFAARYPDIAGRDYDGFVGRMLRQEVLGGEEGGATLVTTQQLLLGTWTRAWTALALGDDEKAIGLAALADRVAREWDRIVKRKTLEEQGAGAAVRLSAASLAKVKAQALEDVKARLAPLLRARLEERAPALSAPGADSPSSGGDK